MMASQQKQKQKQKQRRTCYDCGVETAAVRCADCTVVYQSMRRMESFCRRHGERISRRELRALATCEDSAKAQETVDKLIQRGAEKIQAGWTDAERRRRQGGFASKPWTPPVCSEPPEWSEEV